MGLVINTNISSNNAQRHLIFNSLQLNRSYEKLASGFSINRAADNAAGLQISESLRAQIRGLGQAANNAADGNNMLQVVEGSLGVINEHFQRIRELAVQASNGTLSTTQQDATEAEINQRLRDIDRIAASSEFNGLKLLDGTVATAELQIGANNTANDRINIASAFTAANTSQLFGAAASVNWGTAGSAQTFIGSIDLVMGTVRSQLSRIGAFQNRLDSAINNINISKENLEASESRIRNVDVARESAMLTKYQILQQAAASILGQANQTPSLALSLLGR